jgi:hypothetical protein
MVSSITRWNNSPEEETEMINKILCLFGMHNPWTLEDKSWVCLDCGEIRETPSEPPGEAGDKCKKEKKESGSP